MEHEPITTKSVSQFLISPEFEAMCIQNGFITFGDILIHDTNTLMHKPGFDYRMLRELMSILQSCNRRHLLKN